MVRSMKMLVVAFAVVLGSALAPVAANAAPAQPAPVIKTQAQATDDVGAQASWQCSYSLYYYSAVANCTVYSGYIRLRSYCSGYGYIATSWVGRGSWRLTNNCYPYQRTGTWIDSVG